jgi:catechol 2,3-dioxygenase-like lactoylglutathione lyase family enzyme
MCQSLPYGPVSAGAGTTALIQEGASIVIGRLHHIVLDCPDPDVLARFYSELLGWPITWRHQTWVVVAADARSSGLAFQRVTGYQAPDWPDPERPQQLHLDVMVDDLDEADPLVLALGARRLPTAEPDQGWRVYADPVGHPFCLIPRPSWAPPIRPSAGDPAGR